MRKKTTLALAIVCLGISTMVAQTQRTILYEEFTGENCPPCASTNPGLTSLMHSPGNYPYKILMVRYQCNIPSAPGAGSLYADNPTEVATRQTYYSVPFAPYALFNGIELPDIAGGGANNGHAGLLTQTHITDSSIVNSPFSLGIVYGFNVAQDSVFITSTITAAQAMNSSSLVLHMAMEEALINFTVAPGTNGEKAFADVMRKMVPNASGTTLQTSWSNGTVQTIILKAKIPTYIKKKNQLCFVGWVQDNSTKRVHNSAYGQLNLDAGAMAISGIGGAYTCVTTLVPSVTVKNYGTTTLTSYTVTYKIDAAAAQTIAWTGSLAAGTTATVNLPSQTFTAGNHTITASTSMPNGQTDLFAGNDNTVTNFAVFVSASGTPVNEGFQLAAYPPANWTLVNLDGTTTTWKRASTVGGYQTTTKSTWYDFYNNAADGDHDHLFLPYEDLTMMINPQLSFDYAYAYFSSVGQGTLYDSIAVMISTNCGSTWNTLWLEGGPGLATKPNPPYSDSNSFIPTATMWKSKTINLSAYASSNATLVKFMAINHYGNNLFLDNINLSGAVGVASNNGIITQVSAYPNPASSQLNVSVHLATNEKITVALYNTLGDVVLSQTNDLIAGDNTVNFNTEKLASGIYSVLVTSSNGIYKTKITIGK